MKFPRLGALLITALCAVALLALALFLEGPKRHLAPDEQVPERIVLYKNSIFSRQELVSLTNREAILDVMTALPARHTDPCCACSGHYQLDFYAPTGIIRTISYKPGFEFMGGYVRDSAHQTGQSSVPRRFKRIVGELINKHENR